MTDDARNLALMAVIAVAPLAIVILIALIRGYRMDLHLDRDGRRRRRREDDENGDE